MRLGTEAVLAKEIAVVAEEQDERIVELAGLLERLEDVGHALVDRGHHRGAQANLLLGAGLHAVEQLA